MLLVDDDDANSLSHTLKLNTTKCFGQDVRELVFSSNVLDIDLSFLDTLPDEMEACLDVLTPIMEDRIFTQLNCRLIVHKYCGDVILLAEEVTKKSAEPNSLASRGCRSNVLRLAR